MPNKPLQNNRNHVQQVSISGYSGPLPHPAILKGFEEVQPGAAERIIRMAENEATHRHSLERQDCRSFIMNERLGMVCGLVFGLFVAGGGLYCVLKGHPAAGSIIASIPMGGIIIAFIQGRRKKQ